jgi:hypothetical protein
VLADYGRFQDTLSALLEQAAILGADEICLECHREEDKAVLKATLTMKGKDLVLSDAKLAYLTHSMRLAGGVINSPARNNTPYYTIELPLALTSPVPL